MNLTTFGTKDFGRFPSIPCLWDLFNATVLEKNLS